SPRPRRRAGRSWAGPPGRRRPARRPAPPRTPRPSPAARLSMAPASSLRLTAQVRDDVRAEVRRSHRAEAMERQLTVRPHEEGLRNARRPELTLGEVAASVAKLRICDPIPADEAERVVAEVVGVDSQGREALAAVCPVEALQRRRLVAAG